MQRWGASGGLPRYRCGECQRTFNPLTGTSLARLRSKGGELVDEIAQYEDLYRLCFLRGPEGIVIGLAEQLGRQSGTDA